MKVVVFVCALFCATAYCDRAPYIKPCHSTDRACLKESAQRSVPLVAAGIPSLNMHSLDPMHMDHVQASQAGLNMDFKNTVVKGLRNCQVLDLRRMGAKTALDLKCSVVLIGDYSLSGKLLVLPVQGNGKYKIQIRDIVVKVVLDIGERVVGGETYWKVTGWHHTADVTGGARYQFQNLFNGNKELADPVLKFANSNWHEIFQEVAPPITKAIVSRIVSETSKLFDKVPLKKLQLV